MTSVSFTSGLSLIELMIALCLVVIVMSFGLPFTHHWFQYHRCLAISHDIQQALQQAEAEAVTQGESVRLRPCLECKTWSMGIMILAERDKDHPGLDDSHYEWRWPESDYHVIWHGFVSNHFLRFSPNLGQSALNGYFLIENDQHQGIKLILNRLGRVREEYVSTHA